MNILSITKRSLVNHLMWPQKSHPCDYYFVLLTILFHLFKEIRDYNSCAIRFIPYHELLKNILLKN